MILFDPVDDLLACYSADTLAELQLVQRLSRAAGAFDAVLCTHFAHGGKGAIELGEAVLKASSLSNSFTFLYDLNVRKMPICSKVFLTL